MTQHAIPAVFMRGGSSKGVFFHARDLPTDRADIDPILLTVLGSPDPYARQLDGMGGGLSSLSKAVIVGPPTRPDCDVDFTFAQVAVDKPVVDWKSNCGNLSGAIGAFAVDEGLVQASDGEALVRIHQVNTRKVIHARFAVAGGRAVVTGDYVMAGVAGTGARVRLDFLDPGGAFTGSLLPTGKTIEPLDVPGIGTLTVSMVDAAHCTIFVEAANLGFSGAETPDEIEADKDAMARLDRVRRHGAVAMGLGADVEAVALANPRIALVFSPRDFKMLDAATLPASAYDIGIRILSMERVHRAVPLTSALCLGVATHIAGSVPHRLARHAAGDEIKVGHPSGTLSVSAEMSGASQSNVTSAVVFRTARRLMQGSVLVPRRYGMTMV
jgi:2-methylaconitate cis-trans-isomerase PrpF